MWRPCSISCNGSSSQCSPWPLRPDLLSYSFFSIPCSFCSYARAFARAGCPHCLDCSSLQVSAWPTPDLPQVFVHMSPSQCGLSTLRTLFIFIFLSLFIYLFLAALGLRCCVWAFSSCGEQGLLFVVVHGLLIAVASLVAELGL